MARRYKRKANGQFAGGGGGSSGGGSKGKAKKKPVARAANAYVKGRNARSSKKQTPKTLTKRQAGASIAAGAVLGAVKMGRSYGAAGITIGALAGASGAAAGVARYNNNIRASAKIGKG